MKIISPPCDRYIFTQFVRCTQNNTVQVLQENFPVHSQIQTPSEAISLANREMSGLVRQDHKYDLRSIRYFLRNERPFFLHRESILVQALGFHVLDEVDTLNYGGVSAMRPVPTPTFFIQFSRKYFSQNRILPLIREIYSPRNISALRYP